MAKITSRRSALPLRKNASTKSFINAFVSFIIPFILGMIVSQMLVIPDFDQTKRVAVEDDDYDDDKEVGDDGDINGDGMELEKNFDSNSNSKRKDFVYVPASTEEYIMNHFEELGFNIENYKEAKGCPIWLEPEVSTQENYDNLRAYLNELAIFSAKMEEFDKPVPNLVETIRRMNGNGSSGITDQVELCKIVRPHPDGIQALFPSKQLSLTPAGYAEPLLTPMRHPEYCSEGINLHNLLRLDFLIHDFEQMCLNLKPHSKTILVDIGASLEFNHGGRSRKSEPPIVTFLKTFEKFGFHFDHIYAAEITPFDPKNVFAELLPEKYFTSYHWMNTGMYRSLIFLSVLTHTHAPF